MEKVELEEKVNLEEDVESEGSGSPVKIRKPGDGKALLYIMVALLGVCTVALLIVVIALGVIVGVDRANHAALDNTCLTDGCIQLGAQVKASLNESVDPCEDFYQFACGNWLRTNAIDPGQSSKVRLLDGMDQINVFLRKILESGVDGGVEAVRKAIDLYSSCVNTPLIDELGAQPLLDLINSTGGWQVIGLNEPQPWSINSTTGFIFEITHGSDAFFEIDFEFDLVDSSNYLPYISQGGFTTSVFSQTDPDRDLVAAYRELITTVLGLLYPSGNQNDFEAAADRIIGFERQLFDIALPDTFLRNLGAIYNPYRLSDLPQVWPDFDWQGMVEFVTDRAGYTVEDDQTFIVATPTYFQNLSQIFRSSDATTLRDYTKWHFVQSYLPYLSRDFTDALQVFNGAVQGVQGQLPRTDTCISVVQTVLPIALARPFVEQYVPTGTKRTVSMMIDYVKEAFKERINELGDDWLDNFSRQRSLEKVDAVAEMVAYPDDIMDNDYVNGISEAYEVDARSYFSNIFRTHDFLTQRAIQRVSEGPDRTRWLEEFIPTDINAFYHPSLNQFIFLAGILRIPLFDASWPEYFNFGSFGYVIGHELTHGFDDQGQQFDKDGIFRQWWNTSSIEEFRERQTCFVDQYNNFTFEGFPVNGALTLGENIADNGGINAAFRAYRQKVEEGTATQNTLPGLSYTPDQLFFIGTGQVWCALYTPEVAPIIARDRVHSPAPVRVRGPLMNSEDFAQAFNCKVGTPMNPPAEKKCVLW